MSKKRSTKNEKPDWWIKPPRSSRICYRCQHKYSSHIDVRCLKITSRNPREECDCRGFIANEQEMQMDLDRQLRKKTREDDEKKALKDELILNSNDRST